MYGKKSDSGFQPLPAGINSNVVLKSVTFEPMSNVPGASAQKNVLRFSFFKAATGESFTHTEFPIEEASLRKLAEGWAKGPTAAEKKEQVEKTVAGEYDAQTRRIEHIGRAFIEDFKCPEASSWEDFSRAVISEIGETFKDVPLAVKLVLNKKDYVCFPKYVSKSGFIQKQADPMRLAIDAKYDRIAPLEKKDSASAAFDSDDEDTADAPAGAQPWEQAEDEF
jgi:hypothetical protein